MASRLWHSDQWGHNAWTKGSECWDFSGWSQPIQWPIDVYSWKPQLRSPQGWVWSYYEKPPSLDDLQSTDFLKLWKISWVENTESSVLRDLWVQWFFFLVDRSTPPQAIFPTWNRASVYLRLSALINHVRRSKHPEYIAPRVFTPIELLHDDCLL